MTDIAAPNPALAAGIAQQRSDETPALSAQEKETAEAFEAVFISQFVDQMMKTVDYGPAAGGQGAEIWRSFLSEAMAEQLAERGGLGLSDNIGRMLAAYRD
ncbi:rod-binding protein [Pseudodonghicola flavimaris]|uniref:Rod-binding protein n=1 Tax=Pseudodonghicola flavimaris TaxID=3050036 RepID=A0ABT7EWJ9_9RHOB|nr:rod-binding protein [Pseudodonghicola flavimaris]MDK3016717.1 rod-binding protein [Pseudodonghicola flavimaris]